MVWQTTAPDGAQSVQANKAILQANTDYIKTTMNVDHFWDNGADEAGHHQFVQSPKFEVAAVPDDPTVATGMDGVSYFKQKSAAEALDAQAVLPFFKDDAPNPAVLEILGIRACCLFEGRGTNGAATIRYAHNVSGVQRTAQGLYTISYASDLPTNNYFIHAGASTLGAATFVVLQGFTAAITEVKSVSSCKIVNTNTQNLFDSAQMWVLCFGG